MRVQGVERWVEGKEEVPIWVKKIIRRLSLGPPQPVQRDGVAAVGSGQSSLEAMPQAPKRVVIIGDSLVVGIGCKETPVMPVALCRHLASLLKVDIVWRALGIDGGDVRTIHRWVLSFSWRFGTQRHTRATERA